jgi:hypothetical protein
MAQSPKKAGAGNFVSEWFGHRVYPTVVSDASSIAAQRNEQCPFLSAATGETRLCVKSDAAKGVCTINTLTGGVRKDWLVCPYRAVSTEIVIDAVRQLFGLAAFAVPFITPGITLTKPAVRENIVARLRSGQSVYIYFDAKTSGELSIPPTDKSPEFAFDVTIVELTLHGSTARIGRFGILEIQTMDFHGSYRAAVRNLRDGLRLHPNSFAATLQSNPLWLCEGIEGPNIANVFKRTFYQMMFKFQLGAHDRCVGCMLAIPESVWDSWLRHLGEPVLSKEADGTFSLLAPGRARPNPVPAWIYVFNPDASSAKTPSPMSVSKVIATDVPAMAHGALTVAPLAAIENIGSPTGMLSLLARRLKKLWPDLAKTISI